MMMIKDNFMTHDKDSYGEDWVKYKMNTKEITYMTLHSHNKIITTIKCTEMRKIDTTKMPKKDEYEIRYF